MRKLKLNRRQLLLAGLGGLAVELGASRAAAQDPARVMTRTYRVVLENDKVRVLEFVGRPGMGICGEGMHSHPQRVTIVMNGYQARATRPGGPERLQERKDGDVYWREAETHKVENVGKTNSRVLMVEMKTPPTAKC